MLSSSSPFVERGRGNRWGLVVGAHMVGGLIGGAAMGAVWGLVGLLTVGRLDTVWRAGLLAFGAIVGLAVDARVLGLRLPNSHRQVPEAWRYEYRGWVYGFAYGVLLGAAFATIIPMSATYVVFAGAAASASVPGGALIGAAFGLARASTLLVTRRVDSAAALQRLFVRFHARVRRVAVLTGVTQGALAVGALAVVAR